MIHTSRRSSLRSNTYIHTNKFDFISTNYMLSRLLVLPLFILSTFVVYGQSTSDQVFLPDGSALSGIIKDNSNYESHIVFKEKGDNSYKRILPVDIISFKKNKIEYHSLVEEGMPGFYRLLSKGEITLYEKTDKPNTQEYLAVKDGTLHILRQTREVIDGFITPDNSYVRDLKLLVQDDHDVMMRIDKMSFKKDNLIDLINSYNRRKNNYEAIRQVKEIQSKWSVFAVLHSAGITQSNMSVISSIEPGLGVSYNLFFRPNLYLSTGVSYHLLSRSMDNSTDTRLSIAAYENSLIRVPLEFNWILAHDIVKPKLKLGFGYNRIIDDQRVQTIANFSNPDQISVNSRPLGVNGGFNAAFSAGLLYKRKAYLDLEYSYATFGIGGFIERNTVWQTLSLQLGYFL